MKKSLAVLAVVCAVSLLAAVGSKIDFTLGTAPANPAAGKLRLWANTTSGKLECLDSSGASCIASSGYPTGVQTVTLSATPTFNAATNSVFSLTLGSTTVTSSTLSGATAGQPLFFIINQDATGGRAFVWPTNVLNACSVSPTASKTTIVSAVYDGSNAQVTECVTTDTATLLAGPTRTAPGTPASGLNCWFDSTANTFLCKDASANVYAAVKTAASATSNQWVAYIDANGVPQTSQPASSNLSDGSSLRKTIAAGTTAMPTSALSANTCSASATTATATGALTSDTVVVTYASDPTGVTGYGAGTSGGITIRPWLTANTINFKLCNETGSSITPGALSVNWGVTR